MPVPLLRVGSYDVAASLAGFNDARRAVTLTAGSVFELPLALTRGSLVRSASRNGLSTIAVRKLVY